MNQPTALANPAAPRAFRRLVLGAAFLIGLAVALAPRTPTVHAQEPKPPAVAPKSSTASKTITVTGGPGVEAKIEVKSDRDAKAKAATPGDTAEADDSSADDTDKPGRGVRIGKHGRIQIDGLGGDREFDSFQEFVHDEPAIAGMVVAIVTVVFLSPVLAIGLILWYRMRKARMLNETMLKLAEKGVVTSSDALEALAGGKTAAVLQSSATAAPIYEQAKQIRRRAAWSDLRKGVLTGGVGLALVLFSIIDEGAANGFGLVLLFVGIGFVVLWWFEERQLTPGGGAAAGTRSALGGDPGGPPPSA